jgi:hypothetical protein
MKKHKNPSFVMVTNQVLDAPAWKAMSMGARCLYIALKRRYNQQIKNNGRIYLSVRQAQRELGAGKTQIVRWFRELQHYWFIVPMKPGYLGLDGKGKAPLWRLTEVGYMRGKSSPGMEDMPTMEFLKWNGVRFSKHYPGGDHLKPKSETHRSRKAEHPSHRKKTETRSGFLERTVPENWNTPVPENRNTFATMCSRKPEHTKPSTVPENRNKSDKPSGEGGRVSLREQPQTPVSEVSSSRGNGHDTAPVMPVNVTDPRGRGRPPLGAQAMTPAERQRRSRSERRKGKTGAASQDTPPGQPPEQELPSRPGEPAPSPAPEPRCPQCGSPADPYRGPLILDARRGDRLHEACHRVRRAIESGELRP